MATENTAPQAETAQPAATETAASATQETSVQRDQELADFMADHLAQIRRESGRKVDDGTVSATDTTASIPEAKQEEPTKSEPVAETAAPEATEGAQETQQATLQAEPGKEPEKAKEEPSDERARALADYLRGKKQNSDQAARLKAESDRVKAEDARVKAEAAKVAEERARLARFAELQDKAEKDPAAAFEEFVGKERLSGEVLLQLLDRLNGGEPKPISEEDRQAAITEAALAKMREELRKESDEKAKAKEAEEKAAQERGKAVYFGEVDKHLRANADKFPLMAEDGWDTEDMAKAVEAHHKATGQWPTAEMVLTHFEGLLVQQTERRSGILAARKQKTTEAPVQAPAKSPAAAPVKGSAIDSKGKPGKVINTKSVDERFNDILERL